MVAKQTVRILLIAVLALFASACASSADTADDVETDAAMADSDDAAESADADSSDESGSDDSESDSDEEPSGEVEGESIWETYTSPIQEFLGVDYSNFDSDEAQAEFAQQDREAEEAVAVCMRELGWEYTPVDNSQFFGGFDPFGEDGLEYGSDAWVEKYGFGITTQAFGQSQVGPDLIGYDDSQMMDFEEQEQNDPNFEYVESLSPAEQEAYYSDLYGQQPEFDETLTEEEQEAFWQDYEPTGCQAEAWDDIGFGGAEQEFYEEFGDQLDDLYERVNADPRVIAVQTELTDCMADAGHNLDPSMDLWQQAYEMFEDEMQPLYDIAYTDPFEGVDFESLSDEEIDELLSSMPATGPELDDAAKATLAELQTQEIDMAKDVLGCSPGFFTGVGVDAEVFFEVLTELEQQFLDDNADAIASYAGSGASS